MLQVPLGDGDGGGVDVGERGVVYVVAGARSAPPAAAHARAARRRRRGYTDDAADTHVMAYAVGGGRHVLVNSHPVFADEARIVGTVNESPPDAAPACLEGRRVGQNARRERRRRAGARGVLKKTSAVTITRVGGADSKGLPRPRQGVPPRPVGDDSLDGAVQRHYDAYVVGALR